MSSTNQLIGGVRRARRSSTKKSSRKSSKKSSTKGRKSSTKVRKSSTKVRKSSTKVRKSSTKSRKSSKKSSTKGNKKSSLKGGAKRRSKKSSKKSSKQMSKKSSTKARRSKKSSLKGGAKRRSKKSSTKGCKSSKKSSKKSSLKGGAKRRSRKSSKKSSKKSSTKVRKSTRKTNMKGGELSEKEIQLKRDIYINTLITATTISCIAGALKQVMDIIFKNSKFEGAYPNVLYMLNNMRIGFEEPEQVQAAMMMQTMWTDENVINNKTFSNQVQTPGDKLFIPDEHGLRPKVVAIIDGYMNLIKASKPIQVTSAAKNCLP